MGSEPFSRPVSPEVIYCWASGKSVKGTATHSSESATSLARSARSSGVRVAGTNHRVAAPNDTRSQVMSPGSKASRPIAISRNDDPQIAPIEANSPQSRR